MLNLKLGQGLGSSNNDVFSEDLILICEVGQEMGWKTGGALVSDDKPFISDKEVVDGSFGGPDVALQAVLSKGKGEIFSVEEDIHGPSHNLRTYAPIINFRDSGSMPTMSPHAWLKWYFLSEYWALVPENFYPPPG